MLFMRYNECSMSKFVVHEHHATHLHFDFRLEMEGVLKSWAVPKGPSMNPKDKRLAIMVDDHTLEYSSFEGIIPDGQYGSGAVVIWDSGDYELLKGDIHEGRIEFYLKGKKLKGGFTLIKMSGKRKEWLLIKKQDQFAQPDFVMKTELTPELRKKLKVTIPPCTVS
jgi:bifunctional non-homologous end joining protein LigD